MIVLLFVERISMIETRTMRSMVGTKTTRRRANDVVGGPTVRGRPIPAVTGGIHSRSNALLLNM